MNINLFDTCYQLLNQYIFGGTVVANTYADLFCVLVSGIATLFLISLPFIVVWQFIKMCCRWW